MPSDSCSTLDFETAIGGCIMFQNVVDQKPNRNFLGPLYVS